MGLVKRSGGWTLAIRPFGKKQIWIATGIESKSRAQDIERQILVACKSHDFSFLDPESRAIAITMFRNQGWEMPSSLTGDTSRPEEILTLWRAVELCKKDPGVKASPNKDRMKYSLAHLVKYFGKDMPVKDLWISQVKQFQFERKAAGASASTINKDKAALSRIFQVLMELRLVEANPARMVKNLSEKDGQREIYISYADFQRILPTLPAFFQPIAQVAYYTGMRRGEIVNLTRDKLNLSQRMICLRSGDTKEGKKKRVPIHRDLVPILEAVMKERGLTLTPYVFLNDGRPVTHKDQVRWCWDRRVAKLEGLGNVRFHDLRATWKTNARRSGMNTEIRESIMGHAYRAKSVMERYGSLSDEEFLNAIDQMTFEHGGTEIWVAKEVK